jgi:hypothetical protein
VRLYPIAFLLSAMFALIGQLAPAHAQEVRRTPVEAHADRWLDQRDGEETYSEWAVRNLTTDVVERLIGPAATGTKKQIADRVAAAVRDSRGKGSRCVRAAVEMADYQTQVMGRRETMVGAAQMLWGTLSGAAGGAGTAEDLVRFFGKELAEKILESVRQKAMDRAKDDIRDFFKRDGVETDSASDQRGDCKTFYRMVWDKAHERYDFIIVGDCGCKPTADGTRLSRWSIQGSGSVIPSLQYSEAQGISIRFDVGAATLRVTAACCDAQSNETFTRLPNMGESGDAWVGVEWSNQAAGGRTATPGGANPQPRPIAEPEPPTTATVPMPPRGPNDPMSLTDDAFEALNDQVQRGVDSAEAASEAAERKLINVRGRRGVTDDEIRKAETERDDAEKARNDAVRRRYEMIETRRARNRARQEPQRQQQQQQEQEERDERRDRGIFPTDPLRRPDSEERRRPRLSAIDRMRMDINVTLGASRIDPSECATTDGPSPT